MKKMFWLLPLIFLGLFFSCKSTPELEPQTDTVEQQADISADREKAMEAMNMAKSVKADVAVKDEFNSALEIFNQAESLGSSQAVPAAAKQYREAEKFFLDAYNKAVAKRDEAQRQLILAREAIKSVEADAAALDLEQKADAAGKGTGE